MQECARGGNLDLFSQFWGMQGSNQINWDHMLLYAARGGMQRIVDICVTQGAMDWHCAFQQAAESGNFELVVFFDKLIEEDPKLCGKSHMDKCLKIAARHNYKRLMLFSIQKGASNWQDAMEGAARGGHLDLVQDFIRRGADDMNLGMVAAIEGGHKVLTEFFIEKGANNMTMKNQAEVARKLVGQYLQLHWFTK